MNKDIESQARWYATKVILVLFGILGVLGGLAYINILYTFIALGLSFVYGVAHAMYTDAYYSKLVELEQNDRSKN
jgi:hypothetical protein